MNGSERVLTAFRGGQPDRVPVLEIAISQKVIEGTVPGGDLSAMVDALDMDAIYVRPFYATEPVDEDKYRDEWGILYHRSEEMLGLPIGGAIQSAADLARYVPPDPMAEGRLAELPSIVERYKGRRAVIWHQWEAFLFPSNLVGLESFLYMLQDDPRLVKEIVDMVVDVHVKLARRAVRAGADIVSLGDDYAWHVAPMMSPTQFKELFLPGLKQVVQAIHEEGALCLKHCDGHIWPLVDYFLEAGVDAIHPWEPVAGMDLGEAKRRYGDRVCLVGNVDCGRILSEASVEEVVADVKRCLREAAPGGGYIIASSNSLHSSVRPGNYAAMVDAVHQYGRYPLDMHALEA